MDTRSGPGASEAFAVRHLVGAVHADLEKDLSFPRDPSQGGRHPLPPLQTFARTLGKLGIGPASNVVVVDEGGPGTAAARLWWMLRAIGHSQVAVLDGGLAAAVAAGMKVASGAARVEPLEPYPVVAWSLPTVQIDEVAARVKDPRWMVLDVRSAPRFRGETEPIDPVPGRIPGAKNRFFGDDLDASGRFLPRDDLRSAYEALLGEVPPERLVVHCGSGVTACSALLALDYIGLRGGRLYVGSYGEWCRSGRPIARGD